MRAQILGSLTLIAVCTLAFQNCGKSQDLVAKSFQQLSLGSTAVIPPDVPPGGGGGGGGGQEPPFEGIVFGSFAECSAATNVDACIFKKNPVAFQGGPLSPAPSYTRNYNDLQKFGVKLTNLMPTGFLDNPLFNVVTTTVNQELLQPSGSSGLNNAIVADATNTANRLRKNANGDWKYPYSSGGQADAQKKVAQLMGYHYLESQRLLMRQKAGNFWVEDAGERVLMFAFLPSLRDNAYAYGLPAPLTVDANGDGRTETFGSIIAMGFFTDLIPGAGTAETSVSAEVFLHEMGHRNFARAGTGGNARPAPDLEGGCSGSARASCCRTARGCTGGIHEGQADFHLVFLFPDANNASVGETTVNKLSGLPVCGPMANPTRTRNMASNASMTATEAFSGCSAAGFNGEVHATGAFYASLWYELWRAAPAARRNQIERVFSQHLQSIQPNHDFVNALTAAKAIDQQMNGGANRALFEAQLARLPSTP